MSVATLGTVEWDGVKRILNCIPSRNVGDDWRFRHASDAGLLQAETATQAAPQKDLRDETWWPVGDQGGTGSCVGWALADSVLRWHFVTSGQLAKNERLSPRFQWMAAKESDQFIARPTTFVETAGTSLKAALDVARKFGSVPDAVLPFASGALYPGEVGTFYAIATKRRISSYFNLGRRLADWRSWLSSGGPILVRLDVDRTWDQATATAGKLDSYRANETRGGHAVALVGYTADRFIVRNSWGVGWGAGGYAFASDAYARDAFTEAYGVVVPG